MFRPLAIAIASALFNGRGASITFSATVLPVVALAASVSGDVLTVTAPEPATAYLSPGVRGVTLTVGLDGALESVVTDGGALAWVEAPRYLQQQGQLAWTSKPYR